MFKRFALCFMVAAFVPAMHCVAVADQQSDAETVVGNAVESFQTKGKDYTLKLLGTLSGPFRKGEVYTFALSFSGVMLAHPANKDLVGTSVSDVKDAKGNLILPPQLEVAKNQGAGWTEYLWLRHGEKEPTVKRTYIKRVPGEDIFVAAGYYVK